MTKKNNFERTLAEIEAIVAEIEEGDMSLEDLVPKFKKASILIRECRAMLEKVEQQIEVIEKEADIKVKDDSDDDKISW